MSYQLEVAGNVRAEASRNQVDKEKLREVLGVQKSALYARWNGEREWKLSELAQIAPVIGVPISALTRSEQFSE